MSLEARFWGTRGSVPSPGPLTLRYGGNTSCVELRTPVGELAILDAGTGLRSLGATLQEMAGGGPSTSNIFITHAHWDHIQGLPFFAPLFADGSRVRIWSAAPLLGRLERALRAQMAPDVFPVPFEEVRATVEFLPVPTEGVTVDGFSVRTHPVRHPGGASAFRVNGCNAPGCSVVYIPDNELHPDAPYDAPADWRARLLDFLGGADALIHDATYTTAEYPGVRGWGHSTVDEAVELAADAGVPRLSLFHHHPGRSDEAVDALVEHARRLTRRLGYSLEVTAAAEESALQATAGGDI